MVPVHFFSTAATIFFILFVVGAFLSETFSQYLLSLVLGLISAGCFRIADIYFEEYLEKTIRGYRSKYNEE